LFCDDATGKSKLSAGLTYGDEYIEIQIPEKRILGEMKRG
jgi:hypothetical protein